MTKIHDIEVDSFLADCVRIEPLALEEEFVRSPSDQAYWNERYAQAARHYMRVKLARERTAARLYIEMRETLMVQAQEAANEAAKSAAEAEASALVAAQSEPEPADGKAKKKAPAKKPAVRAAVKPPTVGDIEAAVLENPDMVKAREEEIDAEVECERLKGVLQAVRTKRDMLIQMGAQVRAEMAGDPVLRDQARGERMDRTGP